MSDTNSSVTAALERIVPSIEAHQQRAKINNTFAKPFILGLTGPQGSGKSTWANVIVRDLQQKHGYNALTLSIDDLYRNHDGPLHLRESNVQNKLLRTRGQPGTHDEELAMRFFEQVRQHSLSSTPIRIPVFDKSRFEGEGDRLPEDQWPVVEAGKKLDVLVFEGWCLGFRPLPTDMVTQKWNDAAANDSQLTLGDHALEHVLEINRNLIRYCETFMGPQHLNYLVQLDIKELSTVYTWRIQQEHALIKERGSGMTDDEVIAFVKGYMPSYELYGEGLRKGSFENNSSDGNNRKAKLRLVLDKSRAVVQIDEM